MKANEIRIAEPCGVDWTSMTPDEGGRFCGDCKKVVRNLSSMTEHEATKMLRSANNGELCVRFIYDKEGKIWFGADAPKADPLVPATMLSRAKRLAAVASMAIATQACDVITAEISADETDEPKDLRETMGGVSVAPEDRSLRPKAVDASAGPDASASDGAAADASHADGGTEIY